MSQNKGRVLTRSYETRVVINLVLILIDFIENL